MKGKAYIFARIINKFHSCYISELISAVRRLRLIVSKETFLKQHIRILSLKMLPFFLRHLWSCFAPWTECAQSRFPSSTSVTQPPSSSGSSSAQSPLFAWPCPFSSSGPSNGGPRVTQRVAFAGQQLTRTRWSSTTSSCLSTRSYQEQSWSFPTLWS